VLIVQWKETCICSKAVFTGDKLSGVDDEFPIRNFFAGLNKADVESRTKS
jgi:hypothetical protein